MVIVDVVSGFVPLEGHTVNVVSQCAVVYGGKQGPRTLNGDAFALELHTGVWRRLLIAGEAPLPRAYHTGCRYGSRLYYFGGIVAVGVDDVHFNGFNRFTNVDALPADILQRSGNERQMDHVNIRHVTQQRLEGNSLYCLDLSGRCTWISVPAHGSSPPTRAGHTAAVHDHRMFVYGGYSCHGSGRLQDEESRAIHSVYVLDLKTHIWSHIDMAAGAPQPPKRFGSSANMFGPFWIHYGGIDIASQCEANCTWAFHVFEGTWRRIHEVSPSILPLAFAPTAVVGDTMYVVGGSCDRATRFLPHVHCFDLTAGYWWHKSLPEGEGPLPHCKSALAVVGGEIFCFGGLMTSFRRCDSVFALNVTSSKWREVPTRVISDDAVLDNVQGLPNMNVAFSHQPVATLGARPKVTMVSQGAQTSDEGIASPRGGGGAHSLLAPRLAVSALGPTEALSRTYDAWASMSDNDELFGIARNLQNARESVLKVEQDASSLASMFQSQLAADDIASFSPQQQPHTSRGQLGADDHSVATEIRARQQRFQDLIQSGDSAMAPHIHSYWREELGKLSREHGRWREAAAVDRDVMRMAVTVVDDAPLSVSMSAAGTGSEAAAEIAQRMRDGVKIAPFVKGGYVSPSVTRLGLTNELNKRRQKSTSAQPPTISGAL